MLLLVGLGNPGQKYERTRHNVGFRVAEEVARSTGAVLDQKRWSAVLGIGRLGREQVAILLPQTFMNLSGEAVGQAARFWKVEPQNVVVVHDELDFEFGRLGVKLGGGDGGHNGLKSIRNHLGSGDTLRIRVGIGRPPPKWDSADWVLSKFDGGDEAGLAGPDGLLERASQAAQVAMLEGVGAAMNRFNGKAQSKDAAPKVNQKT